MPCGSAQLKSIYFAGKVDSYRRKLFDDRWAMCTTTDYYNRFYEGAANRGLRKVKTVSGGECLYAGPHALPDNHNTYLQQHGLTDPEANHQLEARPVDEQLENRGHVAEQVVFVGADTNLLRHNFDGFKAASGQTSFGYRDGGFTQEAAVKRCLWQIDEADAVHAYIDSLDCPGTIAELGYASAKGKPIYLVVPKALSTDEAAVHWYSDPAQDRWEVSERHNELTLDLLPAINFVDWYDTLPWIGRATNGTELFRCNAENLEFMIKQHGGSVAEVATECGGASLSRVAVDPRDTIHAAKDELWFVKNLPGVVSCITGGPTDIDPSLLRFPEEKKTPTVPRGMRVEVLARDGYRCRYCGASAADGATLEVDHIIARSRGGENVLWNLQTLCFDCNRGKGTKQLPLAG